MNDLCKQLDVAAFNSQDKIPEAISRGNDSEHAMARIYFRFIGILYRLHKMGISEAELKTIKQGFLRDYNACCVLFQAALKSVREQNKLDFALYECYENSDNCEYCRKASGILGRTTKPDEKSVVIEANGDP